MRLKLVSVNGKTFHSVLAKNAQVNPRITENVEHYSVKNLERMYLFLTEDHQSGFAIKPDGELTALFSSVKGRGETLVRKAIELGAYHLNAFEGHLTQLYSQCGFVEEDREKNWTEGGPDVVWMIIRKDS